jgi:hypothetical protein
MANGPPSLGHTPSMLVLLIISRDAPVVIVTPAPGIDLPS